MNTEQPLELTLEEAFTDGIAYFVDAKRNQYFCPHGDTPIRPLIKGRDDHPMMYQFSKQHPLAETGKKFSSPQDAKKYVRALADFDRLLLLSFALAQSSTAPNKFREERNKSIAQEQERIKKEYLPILEAIPQFEAMRKYLDMTPEQIAKHLQDHSYSRAH